MTALLKLALDEEDAMDAIWRDLTHACRTLQQTPTFTLAAVLTLTLGIGASTRNL
jgi:hypothetical protein